MTPEGRVKDQVKKYLISIGAWFTMPATGGFGASGAPDFLVCWHGKFFGVETKAPGKIGNTTTMQDRQIAGIRAAGGVAIVVDSAEQLKEIFHAK